ncbi:MAG: hypothetical protein JST30_10840 [Armatimonadetes bacterium]|nr:hypothetical protein [Armatimonadota bacterium]
MRVAAVTWSVEPTGDLAKFHAHAERLVDRCAGADLIVLPELPCLELLGGRPDLEQKDIAGYLADFAPETVRFFGALAADRHCTIVGGTLFVRTPEGIENRAIVAFPDGSVTWDLPKVVLTRFEDDDWGLVPGRGLRTLPDPRLGVTVCYDSEFPASGRALAESGVLVQAVPAYTETAHGFRRVRTSCRARAVENQVFVVHASLVGSLGREPVVSAVGSSAVLTPPVGPFPDDAVLAETPHGVEAVTVADLDFEVLLASRESGDVRNWHDRDRGDWSVRPATCSETSRP